MIRTALLISVATVAGVAGVAGCGGGDFCGLEASDLEGTFVLAASNQRSCICHTNNCAADCDYAINDYGATCQDNRCTYLKTESPITISISADGEITLTGQEIDQGFNCEPLDTDLCALKIRCTEDDGDFFEFSLSHS